MPIHRRQRHQQDELSQALAISPLEGHRFNEPIGSSSGCFLAGLDDLVFTGWDIFEDNMYEAASNAGVPTIGFSSS